MMSVDDELSFAMGSKINIGQTEWKKLLRLRQNVSDCLQSGTGDIPAVYSKSLELNTMYLRLIPFDESEGREAYIVKHLKRSLADNLGVVLSLQHSLRAYNAIVELMDQGEDESSDEEDGEGTGETMAL